MNSTTWRVGAWRVNFDAGWIAPRWRFWVKQSYPDARLMLVFAVLVKNAGRLATVEEILATAWPNRVVGRDSVTTAIYQLRQLLGDDTDEPVYIRSEPRRGYRLVARAEPGGRTLSMKFAISASVALLVTAMATSGLGPIKVQADQRFLLVEPLQDVTGSSKMAPLSTAIESTLLSELIDNVPGRVTTQTGDHEDLLRLESRIVACDLGPALLVRIFDTRHDAYFWSKAYALDDVASERHGPTLVEQVADDVMDVFVSL